MASGVDARLLKSTKFPAEFSQKVDMQKVNLQVMKKWIASKIIEILGSEDDVVIELCFNLIEGSRYPDIKSLQIQLTGFLDKDTAPFCKDLWRLLLSAQGSPQGVPKELLEAKKLELIQEKMEADRAAEDARKRRDELDRRDREVDNMKDRDRRDRPAGRGDTWQGRRGGRDFDTRGRDFATREIHTGAIATPREVDVAGGAIVVLIDGHAVVRLQVRRRLGQTREVVVRHAAPIGQTVGTTKLDRGHREDDETSARDQGHLVQTSIDHDRTATAEAVDTPRAVDRDLPLLRSGHLPPNEEDTLLREADQSIDTNDIREVSRHRDPGALLGLVAVVAVSRPSAGARGQEVHEAILQMWRMMALGGSGPTRVVAADALQRDESLATAVDGTVPQLRHSPEPGASQLIFLKMNIAPRHPKLISSL
ncbi:hypothetical protein QQX98_001090 [Neonectria punicea]|uniref:PWI domain-containing protein n=1 Tax=Neonectria punicea TaxID=979145 RepID=A0ABR1HPZ4_9HYPO